MVLPQSEIGELAAFARRSGETWFIGVINGGGNKEIELDLGFLGAGDFEAVILSDLMDSKIGVEREARKVNRDSILKARMREGGGFVAMISVMN